MSIIKNEIPLLEFDTDPSAVISPTHENLDLTLPQRCVFAFLGDCIDRYAHSVGAKQVGSFESATKDYPVYITEYKGEKIALCQAPVGSSPAAQLLDWLIGYGVRKVISAGSCGALDKLSENSFLLPVRALRDEGTSYHYAPPSRFIDVDPVAQEAVKSAFIEHGIAPIDVITWSTDGFYRETKDKVAYRKKEGCSVVEMECSALVAVSKQRGAVFGMILYTADTLSDPEKYDERSWGKDSREYALILALDAVIKL